MTAPHLHGVSGNRKALAAVVTLSALADALLAGYFSWRIPQLPQKIAIHWGMDGKVDGTTTVSGLVQFVVLLEGALLLLALGSCFYEAAGRVVDPQVRLVKYVALAGTWTTVMIHVQVCETNIRSDPASLDWILLAAALLVGPAISICVYLLSNRSTGSIRIDPTV